MKQFFILLGCLVSVIISNGQASKVAIDTTLGFICRKSIQESPLVIINGIIALYSDIKGINPNDVESISILKPPIQFGCGQPRSAIIITTKTANQPVASLINKMLPEEQPKNDQSTVVKVYPNPVLRSQKINVEFKSDNEMKLTMRILSFDGKQINLSEYGASRGVNRYEYLVDPKLTSGMYMFQIIDSNNGLVSSEKLIIQ